MARLFLIRNIADNFQDGCEEVRSVQFGDPGGLPGEQERRGVLPQGVLQQGPREDQELSDVSIRRWLVAWHVI